MESKSIQSSSSSSTAMKYDVFVSFRGEDTRYTFTDHLFAAFQRKGIVAFRDDTNLRQGDHISTELMQAIEGSQVLIVVFSKNYATSSWCLQELAKIMDCIKVPTGQSVLPIFYDVSPSEVRKQSGDYGIAFAEHEERFKHDLQMVQRWRKALVQAADLSGWHVQNKMHDKLQELGMKIVRQNAPNEPWKWSRIWLQEDFRIIMSKKMEMDNLKAIQFSEYYIQENTTLRAEPLSKMNRLRLLIVDSGNFSGSLSNLSNDLQYLEWEDYPFTYFPSSCELIKLVELHLPDSSIKQLWEGKKLLDNLKTVDLRGSKNLVKTPDFSGIPNLERLNLEGCMKLVHIHPSIGNLRKLVYLNLKNCTSLSCLPTSIFGVSSLEVVLLEGCSKLFHSELAENARQGISDTAVQCQSTSSIFKRLKLMLPLHFFNLRRHDDTVDSLMPSLSRFQCLRELDLSFCNLLNIPNAMVSLGCLERLSLRGNNFVTLPRVINDLPRLIHLNLEHCRQLTSLYEFPLHANLPIRGGLVRNDDVAGLSIFDCPKLAEMESWTNVALSWMIQFLKFHVESSPCITIVIPGADVPSWFNSRSVGDAITIEAFPNVQDNNWIGFAFCAAFVVQNDPPSSNGNRPKVFCYFGNPHGWLKVAEMIEPDEITAELTHLCLVLLTRQQVMDYIQHFEDLDGFFFLLSDFQQHLGLKVKHCGLRVVFKQDLEEFNDDK